MPTRTQIVACARTYVGTPFHHQGRIKGKALDCVGLPLSVGEELGVIGTDGTPLTRDLYDEYSSQPAGTYVHDTCCKHLVRKLPNQMQPGDVIGMRLPDFPTHVGIVTSYAGVLYMVHAYDGIGFHRCVEHIIDEKWRRRIVAAFEFPGTTE